MPSLNYYSITTFIFFQLEMDIQSHKYPNHYIIQRSMPCFMGHQIHANQLQADDDMADHTKVNMFSCIYIFTAIL